MSGTHCYESIYMYTFVCFCKLKYFVKKIRLFIWSGNSVTVEKKITSWFQQVFLFCLFVFWFHIPRLGDTGFVVFIDCQALNLLT